MKKPEVGSQKPEVGSQESEVGSQESDSGSRGGGRGCGRRLIVWSVVVGLVGLAGAGAAETNGLAGAVLDLPAVLRLAGAQNLDVQISVEKLAEARANHEGAMWQFFPWLSPGLAYRRHENRIQDVGGVIFDANKQMYTAGGTVVAQVELGEAFYKARAAKQLVEAASRGVESQRQESLLAAAGG